MMTFQQRDCWSLSPSPTSTTMSTIPITARSIRPKIITSSKFPLLLTFILFTLVTLTIFPSITNAAMLDRFDSTFFMNQNYPGEGLYDISLQFSHNPNRESTPQFISFWIQPPKGSLVTHVFVKTTADLRPVLASGAREGVYYKADTTLKSTWYHAPVYIRIDFSDITLTDDIEPWKFTALLCSDRVNCYPEIKDKTVFTYTELVQFPKYSSSSPQYLTRWELPNAGDDDINPGDFHPNSLFEVILTEAFTGVTDLSIFSTNPDPSTREQIDFFDLKFVGYFSFFTPKSERPIKNVCFLNSIPVDVKPMGGAGRALRVYLSNALTTSGNLIDEKVSQIDVNYRNRLLLSCNQNLVIKTDWQSGPYAYSVIKLGHRRETTSQTYEDIVYPHLFYRELSPSYSSVSPMPPPEVREIRTELNLGLGLLMQSFVLNFKRKSSHVLVPNTGEDTTSPNDVTWDTRQYLLPNTNFTVRTLLEDILFDTPLSYGVNEKRSKISKNGFAALFIAPVVPIPEDQQQQQQQSTQSQFNHQQSKPTCDAPSPSRCDNTLFPSMDPNSKSTGKSYGTSYTYTELQYEIPSGSPLLSFEFLSNSTGVPSNGSTSHTGEWTGTDGADLTPFYRSSPISPYRNYQNCLRCELLDDYPVQVYQLMYLPNATFCSKFPVWFTRIQLESRQTELFSDSEFRPLPSYFTSFHLSAYFNIDKMPGLDSLMRPDGCVEVAPTSDGTSEDDPVRSIDMYLASTLASQSLIDDKYEPGNRPKADSMLGENLREIEMSNEQFYQTQYLQQNQQYSSQYRSQDEDDDFIQHTFNEIINNFFSLDWWKQGWDELMVFIYGEDYLYELEEQQQQQQHLTPYQPETTSLSPKNTNNDQFDVQNDVNEQQEEEFSTQFSPEERIEKFLYQKIDSSKFPLFAEWQKHQIKLAEQGRGDSSFGGIDEDVDHEETKNNDDGQSAFSSTPQSQQQQQQDSTELDITLPKSPEEMNFIELMLNDWMVLWDAISTGEPFNWVFITDQTTTSTQQITSNNIDVQFQESILNQKQLYQQKQRQQLSPYSTLSNIISPFTALSTTDQSCAEPLHDHTDAKLTVYAANVSGNGVEFVITGTNCGFLRLSAFGQRELMFDSIHISFPYGRSEWTTKNSTKTNSKSSKSYIDGGNDQFETMDVNINNNNSNTNYNNNHHVSSPLTSLSSLFPATFNNHNQHGVLNMLSSQDSTTTTTTTTLPINPLRPRTHVLCDLSYDSGPIEPLVGSIYHQENLIKFEDLPPPPIYSTTSQITTVAVKCKDVSWAPRKDLSTKKGADNTCFYFHTSSGVRSEDSTTVKSSKKNNNPQAFSIQSLFSFPFSQNNDQAEDNNTLSSLSTNLFALLSTPFTTQDNPPIPIPTPATTVTGSSIKNTQCGVIFDSLNQKDVKFRVDVRVADQDSVLSFSHSRIIGSWQNISPTRGIRYHGLIVPVLVGIILMVFAVSFWSRRHDQLRTARRAEKLAVELESMESDASDSDNDVDVNNTDGNNNGKVKLDENGKPLENTNDDDEDDHQPRLPNKKKKKKSTRVQALLAQLHAAEGVNYYDSDDSDNDQYHNGNTTTPTTRGLGKDDDEFLKYQKEQDDVKRKALEQEQSLARQRKMALGDDVDEDDNKPKRVAVQPTADRAKQARWAAIEAAKAQHEEQKRLRELQQQQQQQQLDNNELP